MFSGNLKFSDDNDDFSLDVENTRTNLSTIFGVSQDENTSLKYIAPKPGEQKQKQKEQNIKKSSEWSIEIAGVVSAFKLINQDNISQGKLGFTVLKNAEGILRIILYRSKTNVLSTTTLNDDVKVYIKNSYLQFKDDLQIFWSVLFDKENDSTAVLQLIKKNVVEEKKVVQTQPTNKIENTKNEEQAENLSLSELNISDQIQSIEEEFPKDAKADILTRMAKMGQPLPQMVTTATTTDHSDSSDNDRELINSKSFTASSKPLIPLRKPKSNSQLVTFAHSQQTISPMMNTINTVASYSSSSLIPTDSNLVNMLMAETRTQNTEVRMNISKLETKIEKILDKIDVIHQESSSTTSRGRNKEDLILDLEEKLLEYKKENRKLKIKIDKLENEQYRNEENFLKNKNEICADDFIEFHQLLDKMGINLDEYNTTTYAIKEFIRKLETEIHSLQSLLNDERIELEEYKKENTKLHVENEEKEKVIEENKTLESKVEELQKMIDSSEKTNKELIEQKENLDKQLQSLLSEVEILKADKIGLSTQIKENDMKSRKIAEDMVKEIMNNLYHVLTSRFIERKSYLSEEILRICAATIKQETNSAIKKTSSNSSNEN